MALSNWDTLAFGPDGKGCNGSIISSDKQVKVSFYKNWLYIYKLGEAESDDGKYQVTHTVHEGQFDVYITPELTLKVWAKRGNQTSVQAVICLQHIDTSNKDRYTYSYQYMIGIGCYGYSGSNWVGVKPTTVTQLQKYIVSLKENYELGKDFPDIQWEGGLRFNQGDAYFANQLGFDRPASVVGEANTPVLMSMIGN